MGDGHSTAHVDIPHVVGVSADIEVVGVDARTRVAGVKDE